MKTNLATAKGAEPRGAPRRKHKRRTQEERSATTRRRLIEAAVECLNDLGYLEATVEVVAARAGVSRGAVQHHFGSRNDLLIAVVEDFGEALSQIEPIDRHLQPSKRVSAAIDLTWELVRSRHFIAVLQIWIATCKIPEVVDATSKAIALMERRLDRRWQALFAELPVPPGRIAVARHIVLATLRGLALRNLYRKGQAPVGEEIAMLKAMVTAAFS